MTTEFNGAWAFLMLILVIGAVPLAVWIMRRLPALRQNGKGSLEVRESLSLGPREKIIVLRSGDKHLLIGATSQSIQLLTELPDYDGKPVLTPGTTTTSDFATQLKDAGHGHKH